MNPFPHYSKLKTLIWGSREQDTKVTVFLKSHSNKETIKPKFLKRKPFFNWRNFYFSWCFQLKTEKKMRFFWQLNIKAQAWQKQKCKSNIFQRFKTILGFTKWTEDLSQWLKLIKERSVVFNDRFLIKSNLFNSSFLAFKISKFNQSKR